MDAAEAIASQLSDELGRQVARQLPHSRAHGENALPPGVLLALPRLRSGIGMPAVDEGESRGIFYMKVDKGNQQRSHGQGLAL